MTQDSNLMVDLRKLAIIGTYDLPGLADKHADASALIASTAGPDESLFRLPGSGGTSTIAANWTAIRDTLQRLAADSTVRIADAGTALVTIAYNYAETDQAGAEGLTASLEEYEESVSDLTSPGDVSDPIYPTDIDQPGLISYPEAPDGDGTGGADYPPAEENP